MRASEALMIGSLQLKAMPYTVNDRQGNGCAIGMMNIANGRCMFFAIDEDYSWFWSVVELPCNCYKSGTALGAMVHLFNEHVCRGIMFPRLLDSYPDADRWTIEQLADWLEKVDPTPKATQEEKSEAVEMFCDSLVSR